MYLERLTKTIEVPVQGGCGGRDVPELGRRRRIQVPITSFRGIAREDWVNALGVSRIALNFIQLAKDAVPRGTNAQSHHIHAG